jgi:sigma-B regulation protein RsbU (phosphoserine phosphatase)
VQEVQSCGNFPVGVAPGAQFEAESFRIEPGDLVCFYSDGVTEAMDAEERSYGSARLRAVAARPAASAAQLMENILKDVHTFVGGARPSDDLTLVCFGAA